MYLRENISRIFPILITKWDISIQPIGQVRYIKENRITLLLFSFEYETWVCSTVCSHYSE